MAIPVSSRFGLRVHPVTGERHQHSGIDIPVPRGTPAYAVFAGKVERVDVDPTKPNGLAVHFVDALGRRWSYLHLDRILVQPGTHVARGQQLGTTGMTGRSTGPHLHLQVAVAGVPVDPIPQLSGLHWRMV